MSVLIDEIAWLSATTGADRAGSGAWMTGGVSKDFIARSSGMVCQIPNMVPRMLARYQIRGCTVLNFGVARLPGHTHGGPHLLYISGRQPLARREHH
jgi:hypothetical protein